jgi:hypothetical protein
LKANFILVFGLLAMMLGTIVLTELGVSREWIMALGVATASTLMTIAFGPIKMAPMTFLGGLTLIYFWFHPKDPLALALLVAAIAANATLVWTMKRKQA